MKQISPAAVVALKDALAVIYWYVRDLQSFLNPIIPSELLAQLNWKETKRNVCNTLVSHLAKNQNRHLDTLIELMAAVTQMTDFSHLEKLEDGSAKAEKAKRTVDALRRYVKPHEDIVEQKKKVEEAKELAESRIQQLNNDTEALEAIRTQFMDVVTKAEPQARGFLLEKILREIFDFFDLDPKASFRTTGEQIDGAFTFDNVDYLLEAKWQNTPVAVDALYAFDGKVNRKLDNTLGLFVSINGFSQDAIVANAHARPAFILMDGGDLMAVLDGRIRLDDLLKRKRRHASQTGVTFLPVTAILQGT